MSVRQLLDHHAPGPRLRMTIFYAMLVGANVGAWLCAWVMFAGHPVLLGTAFLAYVFGLRHAVDADHIAAIDNVVRKLMQDGQRPVFVGLFFSLGHSTVVILAAAGIAVAAVAMQAQFDWFHEVGGVIGTTVSALFLLLIGVANLVILKAVWKVFQRVRRGGALVEDDLDILLAQRGFLARIFRPVFRVVTRSWHMYPLGFLFGLGFDTATEIGLLGISAAQAARGMSFWATMIFPLLFTVGMALVDTTDSAMMVGAYGWAFVNPVRKLWYNLTITSISVMVALLIGGIEAGGLLVDKLGLEGGVWSVISNLNDDLGNLGFLVIGIFILSWGLSALVYRWRRYDELAPKPLPPPRT